MRKMDSNKPKRKKPTGRLSAERFSPGAPGNEVERVILEFPDSKEDIELYVAKRFVAAVSAQLPDEGWTGAVHKLPENGFDCEVISETDGATVDLELVEVVKLSGPYENAPTQRNSMQLVDAVLAK